MHHYCIVHPSNVVGPDFYEPKGGLSRALQNITLLQANHTVIVRLLLALQMLYVASEQESVDYVLYRRRLEQSKHTIVNYLFYETAICAQSSVLSKSFQREETHLSVMHTVYARCSHHLPLSILNAVHKCLTRVSDLTIEPALDKDVVACQ